MSIQDQKLKKFKQLLEISTESLTRDEFLKSFKKVIAHTLKVETKLIEKIDSKTQTEKGKLRHLQNEFDRIIEQAKKDSDSTLSGFRKRTLEAINNLFTRNEVNKKLTDRLRQLDIKLASIRDGIDGMDGKQGERGIDADPIDEEKIIKKVLDKIEVPEIDETKLDKIEEEIEELKSRPIGRLGGGGFSKIHMEQKFIDDETPTGTVNGTNTDFVLANAPNPTGSLKVYVNGMRMRITEDWTLSGRTITFLTAPPTNSIIFVDYRK